MFFLMFLSESVYKEILGKSFTELLEALASTVYLSMKYHSDSGEPVSIKFNLCGAHLILNATLKNSLECITTFKE